MHHVVMFSGGVGSWAAAKRVAAKYGTENLILLFADTRIEDEDLYRFLHEAAANVGGRLEIIADGRTPWQVFHDVRWIGNSRRAPCSHLLKQIPARRWLEEHYGPDDVTVYLGIDWTEIHRWERAREHYKPYRCEAPLCEEPYIDKPDILRRLEEEGIEPPRLYRMGFPHNNCGGACVRAGGRTVVTSAETNARTLQVARGAGAGHAGVPGQRWCLSCGTREMASLGPSLSEN